MERIKTYTYSLFVVIYLLTLFLPHESIDTFLGVLGIIIIVFSYPGANRTFQIITLVFLGLGLWIFYQSKIPVTELPDYMTSTALLLSLLYFLPFINHLIKVGMYEVELKNLLEMRTKHLGQLYYRSSLISYVMCLFVFFSAITIVHQVVDEVSEKIDRSLTQRLTSESVLRSFALANVWSPIEIFIALTVTITGVQYFELLPWALLFSVSLLWIDWVTGWLQYRKQSFQSTDSYDQVIDSRQVFIRIGYLFSMLFLFIFIAFLLEDWLNVSYFNAVILLILPFTLGWALLIGRLKDFLIYNTKNWSFQVNGLQNLMLLFLSLGFFSEMFQETNIIDTLQQPLVDLARWPLILFLIIQILSLLFSMTGIHPLVTITLMGALVQPLLTELNPLSIALVLLTSTLASDAAGTFNTTVTIMSELTGRNPYRITLWNLGYALWFGTAGSLLAVLLL